MASGGFCKTNPKARVVSFATVEANMKIPFNSDLARVGELQRCGSWKVGESAGNAECAVMIGPFFRTD
jgi:hypothetical protein